MPGQFKILMLKMIVLTLAVCLSLVTLLIYKELNSTKLFHYNFGWAKGLKL